MTASGTLELIRAALAHLNPECTYARRLRIGGAIFHITRGGIEGLDLFDSWSKKSKKYVGEKRMVQRWGYYDLRHPNPCTMATLRRFVEEEGTPWEQVTHEAAGGASE
ncbi:PriCT-2 domain-containing protein [Ramlibacter alkalitolerans]|uniref:PriCT-2 domain-containing protein n=1 Tax=Ramlibacter alkalitolerans TaxID=2039631 RepID=A0ABS1JX54_9BURK|nr:PriCT-2 domain-containing protein [Ramlibacter alkalitolerans]MBL0428721.1 PriCT-2 domain-containing protein [Ramlibacter alkalitolerans]